MSGSSGHSPSEHARPWPVSPALTCIEGATNVEKIFTGRRQRAHADACASHCRHQHRPFSVLTIAYSVAAVQRGLNDLGYSAGPVDGLMGSKTRSAIRAYQIDKGLPVSGEPSRSLNDHLQETLMAGFTPATGADFRVDRRSSDAAARSRL